MHLYFIRKIKLQIYFCISLYVCVSYFDICDYLKQICNCYNFSALNIIIPTSEVDIKSAEKIFK